MSNFVYDRNASLAANRVVNEPIEVESGSLNMYRPAEGSFYEKDFEIIKDGSLLIAGTDYFLEVEDHEIFVATGHRAFSVIRIDETEAGTGPATISYRAVGGSQGGGSAIIRALIQMLPQINSGDISWDRVDHPETFPPEEHTHPASNLTELELLRNTVSGLREALAQSGNMGSTGLSLKGDIGRLSNIVAKIKDDLNKIMISTSDVTQEQITDIENALDTVGALVVDNSVRMAVFENELGTVKDAIYTLTTEMGTIFGQFTDDLVVTS